MRTEQNNNGFTLIELLIVVAIIGILAATAIPQFNKYRVNGFNSSAMSDLRNLKTAQESLFAEYQRYGGTAAGGLPGPGLAAGAGIVGPAAAVVSTTDSAGIPRGLVIAVGGKVSICATATPVTFSSYNAVVKHQQADSAFAIDTDSTAFLRHTNYPTALTFNGYSITPADVPAPLMETIEFTAALGWIVM